jgi:hypothetical protein
MPLFEVCDALACRPERVLMLAELCLEPELRRGHGGVYDALNSGEVRVARLRRALSSLPLPAWDDGRIRLAADVGNWLRPDADDLPLEVAGRLGSDRVMYFPGRRDAEPA